MTRALDGIAADGLGDAISAEGLATLSPYQTEHINRFGNYVLDMSIPPAPLPFTLPTKRPLTGHTAVTAVVWGFGPNPCHSPKWPALACGAPPDPMFAIRSRLE